MKTLLYLIAGIYLSIFCSCSSLEDNSFSINKTYPRHQFETDTIELFGEKYSILNPYHEKCSFHLKGSMHNHTDNSSHVDGYGSGEPYFIAKKFRDRGQFDFYCFTDHNYVTEENNVENIIWLGKAIEDTQHHHHLLVYNLPDNYQYQFISEDINEQIDYYHSIGAFVSYAHPDWSGAYQPTDKIVTVDDVDFVEVFNTVEGGSERAYNTLMLNNKVMAFGTDDYHYKSSWDDPDQYFNKSFIVVNTNKRERDAIWTSILKGNFYASTGAKMEISLEGASILIKCEEESDIYVNAPNTINISQTVLVQKYTAQKEVKYQLTGMERIVWIKIKNPTGAAISQPFYITKL